MISAFPLVPISASTMAPHVDGITLALIVICGAIVLLVFGLVILFGILYRRGSGFSRAITLGGSRLLEWGWTVATFFVFLGLFIWGARVYYKMHVPPPGALEISVIGKQWMWNFQHPEGARELNELHVPVNQPVLLTMTSQDVIHSFFVPAFRMKQDVLPGRYTKVWFQATRVGSYHLFCTQYCGTSHADMGGYVFVQSQVDYQRWLQDVGSRSAGETISLRALTPVAEGRQLFQKLACITCHESGSDRIAPDLSRVFGSIVQLNNGGRVKADENYLRSHILDPRKLLVKGFDPIMPAFHGLVSEEDLMNLIAYIKSLNKNVKENPKEGKAREKLPE